MSQHMSVEKVAAGCVVAAAAMCLAYLLLHTLLVPVLLPCGIAYAAAAWVRRVVAHTGVGRLGRAGEKWGGMVLAGILCVAVLWCGVGLVSALAGQAHTLMEAATALWDWTALPAWLTDRVPTQWQTRIDAGITALVEKGAGWLAGAAGAVLTALPGAALAVFFTIASLFYWLADRDGILQALKDMAKTILPTDTSAQPPHSPSPEAAHTPYAKAATEGSPHSAAPQQQHRAEDSPPRTHAHGWTYCRKLWHTAGASAVAYLRAQLSLSAVVFLVLSVGLGLLDTAGYMAWAAFVTIADLLPLLGAGVILLPWAGFVLLAGQTGRGIGLVALWALVWLLRQLLEPRLTGHALGIHPYGMLVLLYTGYQLAGVGGMLCAAVTASLWGSRK